ncbi:hypothetical protein GOQ04_23020 [Emticicia sp. ODNR4P]|nr:hypothetical protein [Emticicia sp. ODNR4P]
MKLKIVVTNACIFIDLFDLELIMSFFKLEIEIHTTSFVYSELLPEQQRILDIYHSVGKLIVHNICESDFIQINLEDYPKAISETDKSVLHIANELSASILSSDKIVINCAKNRGIEYYGMIWIFDRLMETDLICSKTASIKRKQLIQRLNNSKSRCNPN